MLKEPSLTKGEYYLALLPEPTQMVNEVEPLTNPDNGNILVPQHHTWSFQIQPFQVVSIEQPIA